MYVMRKYYALSTLPIIFLRSCKGGVRN
jgi:hypothetical protein